MPSVAAPGCLPMTSHKRAVILLSGWLLMEPPIYLPHSVRNPEATTASVGLNARMSEWEHIASFDTAEPCELARAREQADGERRFGTHKGKKDLEEVQYWQQASARCVPADYIYPPKGPARK